MRYLDHSFNLAAHRIRKSSACALKLTISLLGFGCSTKLFPIRVPFRDQLFGTLDFAVTPLLLRSFFFNAHCYLNLVTLLRERTS